MNPKLIIGSVVILALIGLSTLAITAIQGYGETQYKSGYDARIAEQDQAEQQAKKEALQLERQQREKIDKLQSELQKSSKLTEDLKVEIRNTQFEHDDLGDSFLRLFNLGTQGGLHTDSLAP